MMKKIVKILLAIGATLSTGVIVSRGRDFWGSRASHNAGDYTGENAAVFGDDPAYQMARNPHGNVIFANAAKALQRFCQEHRQSWEPLQKTYSLPGLRADTCTLYQAYQQHALQNGVSPDPMLTVFLQTYLNSVPKQ